LDPSLLEQFGGKGGRSCWANRSARCHRLLFSLGLLLANPVGWNKDRAGGYESTQCCCWRCNGESAERRPLALRMHFDDGRGGGCGSCQGEWLLCCDGRTLFLRLLLRKLTVTKRSGCRSYGFTGFCETNDKRFARRCFFLGCQGFCLSAVRDPGLNDLRRGRGWLLFFRSPGRLRVDRQGGCFLLRSLRWSNRCGQKKPNFAKAFKISIDESED
jgi:hypothetical protein